MNEFLYGMAIAAAVLVGFFTMEWVAAMCLKKSITLYLALLIMEAVIGVIVWVMVLWK